MGIVAHPEVYIFISIHIPAFGPFRFLKVEWIGGKVMDVMRDTSWHHLFGTFEEVFRKRSFLSVSIKEMFHSQNLQKSTTLHSIF
jgi:hypothetical protein